MTDRATARGAWAWMLFDWANQPFYTLVITFIFAPYFASQVVGDPVAGQALWGQVMTIAALLVAFTAPVLGSVADATGRRKPWIAIFSVLFVIGCMGLWMAEPGREPLWPVLLCFILAFAASEYSLIFTNAMLPDLGPKEEIGRISGSGWAMGYAGGVIVLILVLLLVAPSGETGKTLIGLNPIFGLDPEKGEPARAMGPLAGVWLAIFALPLFVLTPDAPKRMALGPAIRQGISSLAGTLRSLPRMGDLTTYLIASLLYRDGLAGLFGFGGIYALGVLGWGITEMGVFGIIAAITGAIGAFLGGRADKAFGPKPVIAISIILLIFVCIAALTTSRGAVLLIPVGEASQLPDIVFFICGGFMGATAGSLQASSRTLLVYLADGRMPMTEAFGLYALSGKATAFIAITLITVTTTLTGSQALGVSPVIVLFALGLGLLYWVKTPAEVRA